MPSFDELLNIGAKVGGRVSIEKVGLAQAVREAQETEENVKYGQAVRRREQNVSSQINQNIEQRKKDRELYGTDDPRKIAAIKTTGAFDPDLAQRMNIDPVGTRAAVDRAIELSGHGGVQDVPDAPPRQFAVGKGVGGEQFFTNLSPAELKAEKHAADAIRGETSQAPVTGLKAFEPGRTGGVSSGSEGAATEKPIEDILFEGRLDQAKQIAEKPERQEARAKAVETAFAEVFDNSLDIRSARQKVQDLLMDGTYKKQGLDLADIKFLDKALLKRGKTPMEMTQPGIDRLFFKPWVKKGDKPGQGGDLAEPASVVNPEGGTPQSVRVHQDNAMALNEASNALESTMPREQTTAYQLAKGKVAKKAGQPKVETGGKAGSVLEDVGGFLEGEGRAGYGEPGAKGVAKDAAAFFGPRLPGDILSAVGGGTALKAAGKGIKAAKKIRAIENMFGSF